MDKRTITALTTMNSSIFDRFGQRMIESWLKYAPGIPLTLYVEGFLLPQVLESKVRQISISATGFREFAKLCEGHPERMGRIADSTTVGRPKWQVQLEDGEPYQFRLDALKFSRKSLAVTDWCIADRSDVVLYLDADTELRQRLEPRDMLAMMPQDADLAILKRNAMYPESGIYMVNLRARGLEFARAFRDLYLSGKIFELEQWHDGWLLGWIIDDMKLNAASLSGAGATTSRPVERGPLGKWFTHVKGLERKARYGRERMI